MNKDRSEKASRSITSAYQAVGITFEHFETRNRMMSDCLELARQSARSDVGILITGETGTGKNLLAQAIHNESVRRNGPFIYVNCSALAENLLEAELFGHEKGAFTGADRLHRGRFELAHGGTIFLDEVGDFTHAAQARLLRVLDYRQLERIGGEKTIETDARTIAASHLDLDHLVKEERFREDLYYRLHDIQLRIPPLRERREDILPLADRFVHEFARKFNKDLVGFGPVARPLLLEHDWPGNVRELRSLIRKGAAIASGRRITVDDLGLAVKKIGVDAGGKPAEDDLSLVEVERKHILHVMAIAGENKSRAARILGISRSTLDRRLKEMG